MEHPEHAKELAAAEKYMRGGVTPHEDVPGWMATALMAELYQLRREQHAVRLACDKRGDQVTAVWQILDEIERAISYTSRPECTAEQMHETWY